MAWRHKSKDLRMSTKDYQEFEDYPSAEHMEDPHSTNGRKLFSPIAEEDGEMFGEPQALKPRPHNTVSPRSSMSPSHSSVSPVSSGSGHSSPRSPTSAHTHLPPPTSQPPPLPATQHARLHPSVSAPGSTKSRSSAQIPKHGSVGIPQRGRNHTHQGGHVSSHPPKSRKPYETHHLIYPKHALPTQHSTQIPTQHSSQIPTQHSSQMPTQHSSGPYQRVTRSNSLGMASYRQIQDGQSNSYEAVTPGNMSVVNVNSKVYPSKVYPMVTDISYIANDRGSPDQPTNEMLNDPGERGSPSGESNPSSTPNSTLGKQTHRQILETIQQVSNGHEGTEGGDSCDGVETVRGTTKVQMGNVSISVQNAHHSPSPPTNQTTVRSPRLEARKNEPEIPMRILHPPKSSVGSKVTQFNQNGNHSGGAAKSDKETPAGKNKEKSSSKETSPVGVTSKTSPTHTNGAKRGISPSSSAEELANINKEGGGTNETDSAHHEVPLLKPDLTKSKVTPPSHPHAPHYTHHHTEAPPYVTNPPYVSLSQPSSLVAPQGVAQGIVPPSLSQQDPQQYMYERPPDLAYTSASLYGRPPGIGYDPTGSRHHISPPHGHPPVRHVVPPQGIGYHVTSMHRGLPPGMQFLRGLPRPEHLMHFTKANVSQAHEAAASGDLKALHRMLTNHEIDMFGYTEHHFTLAHEAALHGRLQVIQFLVDSGLPPTALQIPDDSFTTPAMLAIQGGSVECLQWLVEEGKVPFEVRDTGGETLMHHAAFHGQVKCLEWLLKTVKKRNEQAELTEILDESGVTPAHFAAQGGHLDCLQLLMDYGYSVVHTDRENQKPLDWADAMGQNICVRYLMMYETCWALSGELTHMAEQLAIAQKENSQLRELLTLKDKDHESAISKLLHNHEEKLTKMREHHVDLMASILHMNNHESPPNVGGGASAGSTNKRGGVPVRKAPSEPPSNQKRLSTRPPVHPDASKKRRGVKERHESCDQSRDKGEEPNEIDYRTATPQEVLEKQMTSVAQRMNASREARKRGGVGMTRTFSPLTPIIQRLYSKGDEDGSKGERSSRSQRHSEDQGRRSAPKVKFSKTVTEFPDYSRYDNMPDGPIKSSSPGQSPSHGHHGNKADGGKCESSEHSSRKLSEK